MRSIRIAIPLALMALAAGVLATATPSAAAGPDTGAGSAYGITMTLASTTVVPPTPSVTLPPTGAPPQSATAAPVSVPGLLSSGTLDASTSSTNFSAATETVTSAGGAEDLAVGPTLAPVLTAVAVSSTCTSGATGSTGSTTIVSLSAGGQQIPIPPGVDVPLTLPASVSPLISVEVNRQSGSNATGSTSIVVDALVVTLLGGFDAGAVITVGDSRCSASGPDIVPAAAPTVTGIDPHSGPAAGGTPVTITGTGFTGTPTVDFGSSPATGVVVVDPTEITATSPAGAGTVPVTVTVGGHTSATSPADLFTYIAPPTVTGIDPNSGPTTGGTSVTVTGTGFSGAPVVDFGSNPATDVDVVSPTEITATSPAGTGTVPVTVTVDGMTSATSPADLFTYTSGGPPPSPPTVSGISPTTGPPQGGNTVTIVGTNLCNTLEILFGTTQSNHFTVNATCTTLTVTVPGGTGTVPVTVTTAGGTAQSPEDYTYIEPGYWMAASDGGVFSFGGARYYGSMGGHPLNQPIVSMAETPDDRGYWLFASDGGVFAFGDARFFGSVPGVLAPQHHTLNAPIVAAEVTPDGHGYRMFAGDGGVFDFGDARFVGSLPGLAITPVRPVVAATSDPFGQGYWLVAGDGGVFTFGDAPYLGSLGGRSLSAPIIGMSPTSSGGGYWVYGADGAVYPFGNAHPFGSMSAHRLNQPIVFGAATTTDGGYWLFSTDGGVFNFGDAPFEGSLGDTHLNKPIVAGIGF